MGKITIKLTFVSAPFLGVPGLSKDPFISKVWQNRAKIVPYLEPNFFRKISSCSPKTQYFWSKFGSPELLVIRTLGHPNFGLSIRRFVSSFWWGRGGRWVPRPKSQSCKQTVCVCPMGWMGSCLLGHNHKLVKVRIICSVYDPSDPFPLPKNACFTAETEIIDFFQFETIISCFPSYLFWTSYAITDRTSNHSLLRAPTSHPVKIKMYF